MYGPQSYGAAGALMQFGGGAEQDFYATRVPAAQPDQASYATKVPFGQSDQGLYPTKVPFGRRPRKRLNALAILVSVLVPWFVFAMVSTLTTFSVRFFSEHDQTNTYTTLLLLTLLPVVAVGCLALVAMRRSFEGEIQPTWYIFMFITCIVAWLAAYASGNANYVKNLLPYYTTVNLNAYPLVDPQTTKGQQLLDMGMVRFVDSARLDLRLSIGFKDRQMYCVAPIVSGNGTATRYDFWAVGLNCCSGRAPEFTCGEFSNPLAHSGLRIMDTSLTPFFRLAVQQAQAAYNIQAVHPVFMYFMQDPSAEVNTYYDEGCQRHISMVCSYFVVQLLVVLVAAVTHM